MMMHQMMKPLSCRRYDEPDVDYDMCVQRDDDEDDTAADEDDFEFEDV